MLFFDFVVCFVLGGLGLGVVRLAFTCGCGFTGCFLFVVVRVWWLDGFVLGYLIDCHDLCIVVGITLLFDLFVLLIGGIVGLLFVCFCLVMFWGCRFELWFGCFVCWVIVWGCCLWLIVVCFCWVVYFCLFWFGGLFGWW